MSISSATRKAGPYSGNGVAVAFPFSFKVFTTADVLVVFTALTGVETVLTLGAEYTVEISANQDSNPGGTVTLPAALATGEKLTLTSAVANLQPVTLTNQGGFYPKVINDALDRATIQIQQLAEKLGRSLRIPVSVSGVSPELPAPFPLKLLGWNATGDEIENVDRTSAALMEFIQVGTGTVATTVQAKLRESVSVKDYGAIGDGYTDDTAAIQTAITSNPAKAIYFPYGSYKVTATINITSDNTTLFGDATGRSYIKQYTPNIDTIKFTPTTAGATSAFLNNSRISGLIIDHSNVAVSSTTGAAVRFVQCNSYSLEKVIVYNAPEGITVMGGQFGSLKAFRIFVSSGLTSTADTALLYFRQAPYGSGQYQPCFTVNVEDFFLSATKLRETCIYIRNADGINFTNGYLGYGDYSLVAVKAERDNSYVSGVQFANVYFDCVGLSGTENGIYIPDDTFTNSFVYLFTVGSGCIIGNGRGIGVLSTKPQVQILAISGATIINMSKWAVQVTGATATTDLHITGSQISNCGDGTSGGVLFNTGRTLNLANTVFTATENLCVSLGGTINQGVICGCSNTASVADLANSAAFTNGLVTSGNSSAWPGPTLSWEVNDRIYAQATLDFPSTAVGSVATLTTTVTGAKVGDSVLVNINGGTNIVSTGGAYFLFVGGVTAIDTVSIRCINLAGVTADPASLIFNITVFK
jgi:hypothetical protein